ncbi:MAG: P-II family nitrogen regulator [Actinomycetota bacterium]
MLSLVTAVVKPHQLEPVVEALKQVDVHGLTATEVKGFGRQGGHSETYRGTEYHLDFIPKVKIEVVVDATRADDAVEAIAEAARTGRIGDGKVWVTAVSDIMRIRTGERGSEAL